MRTILTLAAAMLCSGSAFAAVAAESPTLQQAGRIRDLHSAAYYGRTNETARVLAGKGYTGQKSEAPVVAAATLNDNKPKGPAPTLAGPKMPKVAGTTILSKPPAGEDKAAAKKEEKKESLLDKLPVKQMAIAGVAGALLMSAFAWAFGFPIVGGFLLGALLFGFMAYWLNK